ncbi:MAG TPA: DUF1349 domain-containing protein [Clostridia bacterium]
MDFNISNFKWINKPDNFIVDSDKIVITTEPETDYWQKTYYGFCNDNAHTFVMPTDSDFTFTVKTQFDTKTMYDQCGVIIYQNSDNWFKASIEYENEKFQRLGSVVTNNGYSDWATTDISSKIKSMYYRLSRRGSDFRIENSIDGENYEQMRIFHLFQGKGEINLGVYACSPLKSSFDAVFTEMKLLDCIWE